MASQQRPTAAFVLVLIGGILVLLSSIVFAALLPFLIPGAVSAILPVISVVGWVFVILAIVMLILSIITILSAFKIRSGVPETVKRWSIIALILGIIELIMGAGLFIGPILIIVGAILGLIWKPPPPAPTPSTPQPTT